jgi:uncharacterized delta-60 repeat protein
LVLSVLLLLAIAVVLVFVVRSRAGGGDVDTTFNPAGVGSNNNVNTVALQPDGKIIFGGIFISYNGDATVSHFVMRLNADGTRDTTFNIGGTGAGGVGPSANTTVNAVALQPDGKIVIGGNFTLYNGTAVSSGVMRLNADGTRDPTFNIGGSGTTLLVNAVAVQPDGKIVIGGLFTSYNGDAAASDRVIRLNADGTRDTTFNVGGAGANLIVYAAALQPDGKILIGGDFTSYNGDTSVSGRVMRLNADGTRDTAFNVGGAGANDTVELVAVRPDGRIIIGGNFTTYDGDATVSRHVMRLNADGTRDTSFNVGGVGADGPVGSVAVQSDGKMVIGGSFSTYNGGATCFRINRLNADGTRDLTFNTGGFGFNGAGVSAVVLQPDGKIVVGGTFTSYNFNEAASDRIIQLWAVNPNHPPSFTKGADQTVNEDAGAQTINNWATAISTGSGEDPGQTVTFQVTNNTNAALFSAGPAISATGTLTYTPAANVNGSATITINLKDDGGTANGGADTSASQAFTITVNAVNDAPSFAKGADQTANNNAGAQTVTNWATNISKGPSDESAQTITFQVTGNTTPGLFSAGPAVSSTGTLTYTPSTSGGGTATITLVVTDNGGTALGGADTSASQSFMITVTPAGGFVNFASATGNTTENSGSTTVNVVRTGDTSKAITVNYATNADTGVPCSTANGVASPKCDFTAALGTLSFAAGETSKRITILISQDSFVEGPETITVTLSSPTGNAAVGTPSSMAVTINDDATEPPGNIIDDPNMFVRMHYHDFLNREGDQSGLGFWTGQMSNCGSPDLTVCRVNVSGAFFLSIEFQQTGYLVERIYKTAYGDATATSSLGGAHQVFVPLVRANEFLTDTQRIGRGVVVLQPGWEQVLENNKQAYALEFVQTTRFISALPTSMTPTQFVDKLNQNAGNVLSPSERTTAINLFGIGADTTNVNARAQALRQIADDQDLYNAELNRAFVLSEYIGYLRRNPNDAPEPTLDYTGYEFWLSKLNQFNGDYIAAEMVKAFISSSEYRGRFGP